MKSTGLISRQSMFTALTLFFTASFALTLWMAFYVPVYGDEIAWKLFSNRQFVDHGKLVYIFAQCDKGYWLDTPITWYPMQWLDSLIYGNASNDRLLRILGSMGFVLLLGSWTVILRSTSQLPWLICTLFVTVFFSFGITPFLMVFNRPELPLLLWLTLALMLSLWFDRHPLQTRTSKILLTLVFALIACLMTATHPKGLFFFPLLLLAWWRSVRWWPAVLPLLTVMAWTGFETNRIWSIRTSCEEYPGLSALLKSLTLRPNQLWQQPLDFMTGVFTNIKHSTQYISKMAFDAAYSADWLPAGGATFSKLSVVWVSQILVWLPIVLMTIVIVWNTINLVTSTTRDRRFWPFASLIFLSLMMIMSFQTAKNFYEPSLIWPLILLVTIYSFHGTQNNTEIANSQRIVRWVLPTLLIASLLSGYMRYELFFHHAQSWQIKQSQDHSLKINELQQFAQNQCGIEPHTPNLALSLVAYGSFWEHPKPIILDYSTGWWATEANFAQTMHKREAGGLVAECRDLPPEIKPFAKRQGKNCCVSGHDLRNLINLPSTQK
mgnify:CR=1 FL=1|jgi:hypothetical protein